MSRSRYCCAFAALLIPFAFACATVQPPTDMISAAERSIGEATQNDAEPYARLHLHLAREHLGEARVAMEEERNKEARELAEKAMVESELANAKANSIRAQRNVTEIRDHIATLRREIERAGAIR